MPALHATIFINRFLSVNHDSIVRTCFAFSRYDLCPKFLLRILTVLKLHLGEVERISFLVIPCEESLLSHIESYTVIILVSSLLWLVRVARCLADQASNLQLNDDT